ncbi:hypothetical protein NQ366_26555, partial [Escherichia coli]|nr:hypothetical protein [Escherichia coli]
LSAQYRALHARDAGDRIGSPCEVVHICHMFMIREHMISMNGKAALFKKIQCSCNVNVMEV